MNHNSRLKRVLERSKDQGLVLGIQLASGSLYRGVVEQLDDEVLLMRDRKGRETLLTCSGIVAAFPGEKGVSLWEGGRSKREKGDQR